MKLRDRFSQIVQNWISDDEWLVAEKSYHSQDNLVYETNFCLASGAMGSRASHEEGFVRQTLPANYVHGVFDRSEAFQRELCNTPDWTKLKIYFQREPIALETGKPPEDYLRVLDMRHGFVAKHYIAVSHDGRRTQIEIVKFLSRANPRCGLIKLFLTPLNYGGLFEFENIIDATVTNFIDFPRFRVKHLDTAEIDAFEAFGAYVGSRTRDFQLPVGTGTAVKIVSPSDEDVLKSRAFKKFGEVACEFLDTYIGEGETVCVEKYAAVCSGRDFQNVRDAVLRELIAVTQTGFEEEFGAHFDAYDTLWNAADVVIRGDDAMQKALRFNIFHLMSTPNPTDPRTNIGAKLIHGEEYGGHAFWDTELFILPFFDYVFPEVARGLVGYRYLLLDKARENAKLGGFRGAKYPWESADTGDEECPAWTIEPDGTCYRCYVADYEHHVTAAVAFGAANYYRLTRDDDFFKKEGLEILAETARFWASRLEYNEESDRYEIRRVTGPDEWHEPVDNNAYTNHLARWNIKKAIACLEEFRASDPAAYCELTRKIGLTKEELSEWERRAAKIYLKNTKGLIEQFDGYFELEDAVIDTWDKNHMPILPKALEKVPKERRCILKQADVVMLMFLLEYEFDQETQRENFDYYEIRTLHRSSLSPSIHCLMGLRVGDPSRAYDYLRRSAFVDIANNQRNTREGVHAASAGGTWQCVTLGYCGMTVNEAGALVFHPRLPEQWQSVDYSIRRQGASLRIHVENGDVTVRQDGGEIAQRYYVFDEERQARFTLIKR